MPPAAELGPEDQQALGPAGHEFGVAAPFSDRRRRHSSAIHVAGLVDEVSGAPEGGHQGDVARQGFATCGCAVDEEVQPALVIGWHSERCAGQPGLGNHASFRANPFAATRIQACSRTWARRRRARSLRGQARAWSPNRSSGPPHPCWLGAPPHRAAVTGRGARRRRRNAMCMRGGGIVRPGSLGMAVSHAPAWGPAWERSRARAGGDKAGSNSRSRKEV